LCVLSQLRLTFASLCGWLRGLFVTSEMIKGAIGAACAAVSGASEVTGRAVVFRTGVNPVRGLFRLLGVIATPRSFASTPSDVNPWTGAGSSPSSGAARFLPATMVVIGMGSWGLRAGAFAGSSAFAWKAEEEERRVSGVLRPRSVEGPDITRERDGGVDGTAEVEGDDLVYRAEAATGG
jgi:hypothetical protein